MEEFKNCNGSRVRKAHQDLIDKMKREGQLILLSGRRVGCNYFFIDHIKRKCCDKTTANKNLTA